MDAAQQLSSFLDRIDQSRVKLAKFVKELRGARCGDGWDFVALARILRSWEAVHHGQMDLRAELETTRAIIEHSASGTIMQMEADVRDICSRRRWRVDGEWPRLYVERAIDFEADEENHTISIDGSKLRRYLPVEVEAAIDRATKKILPRGFTVEGFMSQLSRAYDQASGGRSAEVPLLQVYRELVLLSQSSRLWRDARATAFTELSVNQFRGRLSAVLEAGQAAPDGRELRLLPPIDPRDAIFVFQPAERRFGFVGRIEFRRVPKNEGR